ncbi:hypothetical protein NDU88_004290 [Pleurodeles waltl]|uniref:Uncharacterized protein n=1 Tax=Pleurodeles waltl TaxID=8319 RepID=A0AAV7V0Z3_PLEWA|nr:hypothetical protein NDU88_004290 [Pleurodeles waltl]
MDCSMRGWQRYDAGKKLISEVEEEATSSLQKRWRQLVCWTRDLMRQLVCWTRDLMRQLVGCTRDLVRGGVMDLGSGERGGVMDLGSGERGGVMDQRYGSHGAVRLGTEHLAAGMRPRGAQDGWKGALGELALNGAGCR